MAWIVLIIVTSLIILMIQKQKKNSVTKNYKVSRLPTHFQETPEKLLSADTVILDTETTGLTASSEIVEISIIDTNAEILLNSLVQPKRKMRVGNKAMSIHRITNEMLLDAPQWKDIHEQFCSIIEGKKVAIYNSKFDLRLLEQTVEKYNLTLPEIDSECLMMLYGAWDGTPSRYEGFKWHTLDSAAKSLNIKISGIPHRSLTDCQTALAVLKEMKKRKPKVFERYR